MRHLLAIFSLWLLVLVFFRPVLLDGADFARGDFTEQFYAFRSFALSELREGRLPLWNPYAYAGHPFLADPQSAVLYPPALINLLLHLPGQRLPIRALEIEAVAHFLMAAAFTYSLAIRLTGRCLPAMLSALLFAMGGYLTSYPPLQLAVLETAVWLPLVLLLLLKAARQGYPFAVLAGLGLALATLAGHGQTLLLLAYLAVAFFLFESWMAAREDDRPVAAIRWWTTTSALGKLLLFLGFGLGAAAAQLLPTAEYVLLTHRAHMPWEEASTGFNWDELPMVVWAIPGHDYFPLYVGPVPVLLAVAALVRPSPRVFFWWAVAIFALLLSLGGRTPLFGLLYQWAPGFQLFRGQERAAFLFAFSLSMLAGFGLSNLISGSPFSSTARGPGGEAPTGLRMRLLPVLLLLLVAADLFRVNGRALFGPAFDEGDLAPPGPALEVLQRAAGPFRVLDEIGAPASYGYLYQMEEVRGVSPLTLASYQRLLEEVPHPQLWRMLNVRYVLTWPQRDVDGTVVAQEGHVALYRLTGSRPRLWVVHEASPEASLLSQDDFDPFRVAVMEHPPALPGGPPAPDETVRLLEHGPQRLLADARLASDGLVVAAELDYPGWRARVDGHQAPVLRVDAALRAVHVPAGGHLIEFYFDPLSFRIGSGITLLVLAVALVLVRLSRMSARQSPEHRVRDERDRPPRHLPLPARHGVILLSVVALGIRLYGLDHRPLRGDEAFGAFLARQGLPEMWTTIVASDEPHPPLYYTLLHVWLLLAGDSELALRLPSVLFGALAVPLTYAMARRLFGTGAGLLAALLIVGSSQHLWYSQEARMYSLVMALSAGSTWLLLEALHRDRWRWWSAYSLCVAALLYTHYFGAFLLAGHGMLALGARWLWPWRQERARTEGPDPGQILPSGPRTLRWMLAIAVALLLFGPWAFHVAGMALGHEKDWVPPVDAFSFLGRTLLAFLVSPASVPGQPVAGTPPLAFALAWSVLLLAGLLAFATDRRPLSAGSLPALVLVLAPLVTVYVASLVRPLFLERFMTFLLPPFLVLLAGAALHFSAHRHWPAAGVALVFLAGNLSVHAAYLGDPSWRENGLHVAAAFLLRELGPGDVVLSNFPDPAFAYYLGYPGNSGPPAYVAPDHPTVSPEEVASQLQTLVSGARRIWFLPQQAPGWDRDGLVGRWLDMHALKVAEARPGGVLVQRYETAEALRDGQPGFQPVDFDGQVRLAAYHVPEGAVAPGEDLSVAMFWEAMSPMARDYTIFLHLTDATGHVLAQKDGPPGNQAPPTSHWLPGETMAERRTVAIPADMPPGRYQLRAGVYSLASGQRLITDSGQDYVLLTEIDVHP